MLAARFPAISRDTFVVIHCKEPATDAAAGLIGAFIGRIGEAVGGSRSTVAMIDSNLATSALCVAFALSLSGHALDALPSPGVATTSKQRSILHGQCYKAKKCMTLVVALKNKVIAPMGRLSQLTCFPDVRELPKGLPSPSWASDHALTTAVLKL